MAKCNRAVEFMFKNPDGENKFVCQHHRDKVIDYYKSMSKLPGMGKITPPKISLVGEHYKPEELGDVCCDGD